MAGRKKQTFEQTMARLEEIVGLLENAEQKITILTQDKDGSLEEKPLDAEGDAT